MIDHVVELICVHPFRARQIRKNAGIQVATARAHGQAGRRRERHARVDALAILDRRHARTAAKVRQNHPAVRRLRAVQPPAVPPAETCTTARGIRNAAPPSPRSDAGSAAAWPRAASARGTRCQSRRPAAAGGNMLGPPGSSRFPPGDGPGSMEVMRCSSPSNSGLTRCGSWYFGPPCTTRCANDTNRAEVSACLEPIQQCPRHPRRRVRRESFGLGFLPPRL